MYRGTPRTCHICGEVEGRDATPQEIVDMVAPPKIMREYENRKWTGKHICARCYSRTMNKNRRAEPAPIPPKIEVCRTKYGIILRIVKGLPVCIKRNTSLEIHHGIDCNGCSQNIDEPP